MALILDTNALSGFADGDVRLLAQLEDDIAIPVVVLGEYLFGVRQSKHRARYSRWLAENLPLFLVLSIGTGTATAYADIRSELKTAGRPIPTNDLWIASLAREHGWPLATRDRHFEAVRGLRRITW